MIRVLVSLGMALLVTAQIAAVLALAGMFEGLR
jgi:hypothetical protein